MSPQEIDKNSIINSLYSNNAKSDNSHSKNDNYDKNVTILFHAQIVRN